MSDVASMNKDQLKEYAKEKHGVDLNMQSKIEQLRGQVSSLDNQKEQKTQSAKVEVEPVQDAIDGWVQNPDTGLAFYVEDPVAKENPSWKPCTKEGKLIG